LNEFEEKNHDFLSTWIRVMVGLRDSETGIYMKDADLYKVGCFECVRFVFASRIEWISGDSFNLAMHESQ
jgi:hypothetical protein